MQRFGHLVHEGLDAWTVAVKDGAPELECVERAIAAMRAPAQRLAPDQPRPVTPMEISL